MRAWSVLGACGLLATTYLFACGTGSNSSSDGKGGAGGGAGGATGGTSAGGAAGTSTGGSGASDGGGSGDGGSSASGASGGASDSGLPDVVFTYDGPIEDDGSIGDACGSKTEVATPTPLDMYIMQDNSGSMASPQIFNGDCNIGQQVDSKWCYAINALDKFFKAAPLQTGVALQYFGKCVPNASECSTGATCSIPEVALGQLPGNLTALENSLNLNAPTSGTPTEAALRGIATFTANNKQPGRVMIGILITDGIPEACNTNAGVLQGIASAHLAATGIKTFVIGMTGASYSTLDTIGQGGGAPQHTQYCNGSVTPCYYYDVGKGDGTAFTAVLNTIQKLSVGCQFNMPQPAGGIPDPNKIEVLYSPGGVPPAQKISKVNDATACGVNGGWYYDNNSNPKFINLCPETCKVVQADSLGKIEINLGCLGS